MREFFWTSYTDMLTTVRDRIASLSRAVGE